MLNKNDKVIEVRLYSPHIADFIFERENGTHYVMIKRHDVDYYELNTNPTQETKWTFGNKIK